MFRYRLILASISFVFTAALAPADNFTLEQSIDFFRDVSSRNLKGLAVRSDGRLLSGPTLAPLTSNLEVDLAWDIEALSPHRWLIATGPEGGIYELTRAPQTGELTTKRWAELESGHVFKLLKLQDGRVIAGTSPTGLLVLFSNRGEQLAKVNLAADSVFDLLEWDGGQTVLVATGNPGKIMRVDLEKWVATVPAGTPAEPTETAGKADSSVSLAERGVTEFGTIRDRNVRTLTRGANGTVLAGSAPQGNLYRFASTGGDPIILLNHENAEITDIHLAANGDVFAAVVHSASPQKTRVVAATQNPATSSNGTNNGTKPGTSIMEVAPATTFTGRSVLIKIPGGNGLPETVLSRTGVAIYRIVQQGQVLILPGGDSGELIGYDTTANRSLTFSGSDSAQITDIVQDEREGNYLLLTNNPVALASLDFNSTGIHQAETDRLNLRALSTIGAIRFNRLRGIEPGEMSLSIKTNRGSDESEGWTDWMPLSPLGRSWKTDGLVGEYVKLRIEFPPSLSAPVQVDRGTVFHSPLNRRPMLQSFQLMTPNFGLEPRVESKASNPPTLAQVLSDKTTSRAQAESERAKANLLASQVTPRPGAQLVTWSISDADGDQLLGSFSVRRDESAPWIDLAVNAEQAWVQFDRATLPDGIYFTKLVVRETAPRAIDQRLEVTFETDDLVIDQTPPTIADVQVVQGSETVTFVVAGQDEMSMLLGIEIALNNGRYFESDQTDDGILDQQAERFTLTLSNAELDGATAFQVTLQDAAGNARTKRVELR